MNAQNKAGKDLEDRIGEVLDEIPEIDIYFNLKEETTQQLKQLFIDTFIGVVGEDEQGYGFNAGVTSSAQSARNQLRQELRAALNTIKGEQSE